MKRRESGFALLLVFLMAAVIALSLYMEIPRVAFESQRQKEQLLIERGEQYKRAIKLFVSPKGAGRWPSKMEDLENFNNRRYLRHRYIDPMTGKDEWRLIHIANGVLTDSVVTKPAKPGDKKTTDSGNSYVGEIAGMGQTPAGQGQNVVNPALRRRPSDSATPGMSGGQGPTDQQQVQPGMAQFAGQMPGQQIPGQSGVPQYPGQPGAQTGAQTAVLPPGVTVPNQGNLPGQQASAAGSAQGGTSYVGGGGSSVGGGSSIGGVSPGGLFAAGAAGAQPGQAGGYPGQQGLPGQYPGMPGATANLQSGGMQQSSFPQSGMSTDQQNTAAKMIGDLLTRARPNGMPGANPGSGQVIGGGIAGVASKAEGDSIMVYNEHSNYSEWEFIYDPMKDKPLFNPVSGTVAIQPGQAGSLAGQSGTQSGQTGTQSGQTGMQPSQFGTQPSQIGTQPSQFGGPGFGQGPGR
jgi:hypothetical protein